MKAFIMDLSGKHSMKQAYSENQKKKLNLEIWNEI